MTDPSLPTEIKPKALECDLLVLGASFTGIEVMHQLQRRGVLDTIDTVVVDARATHGYIPLAHELVAGDVESAAYVLPTAEYVRSLPRSTYLVDTVVSVDPARRRVQLSSGRNLTARALVLTLGSRVESPTHLVSATPVSGVKFLEQCQDVRERLQSCAPGRLVVIGGGITGVELAGELAAWAKQSAQGFSVTLIDAHDQLLTNSGSGASLCALRLLHQLGVDVMLRTRVNVVERNRIVVASIRDAGHAPLTTELPCALVVWAGGIAPASVNRQLGVQLDETGWIDVDPALRAKNARGEPFPSVFAGGDAVRVCDETGRWPTMQRAIECIWQGKVLARNVATLLQAPARNTGAPNSTTLARHRLIRDFPFGISIGPHSLVMYRAFVVNLGALGVAFRRWLMRRYLARYHPRKSRG